MYSKIITAAVLSAVLAAPAMAGTTHPVTNTLHSTHGAVVSHSSHGDMSSHSHGALANHSHGAMSKTH
jgi:hypothetical protein